MNLQHKLAELVAMPFVDGKESEEEQALFIYGIEIFLNEFLKVIFIFLIAVLVGKIKIAALGTSYLLLARRCSGGRHFKSNIACTLFTIFTAFVGPLCVSVLHAPLWSLLGIAILETGLIYLCIPYTKDFVLNAIQKRYRKISATLLFWGFVILAEFVGGNTIVNGILLIEGIVIVSAFNYKKA